MHRHVHALALILLAFVAFGVLQLAFFPEYPISPFGFAVNNVSNASSGAQGAICIGARPPEITDIPDHTAAINQLFTYMVNATQTNGHALTFTDDTALFTIGSSTGLISFTPTDEQAGGYTITITAIDPEGCSAANDTDTFVLNVTNATTTPPPIVPIPNNRPAPRPQPPSIRAPPPQRVEVFAPYYVIDIRQIVINSEVVYDQYRNIRLPESVVAPNSLVTIQVTVRNVGFNPLTGVQLDMPLPAGAELLSINPPRLAQLDPNQEFTFTAQIQMGEQPFDLPITARADQDTDVEVAPLVMEPSFETPQFGFAVPPWLPLFIAIPLLFFLGYSLTRNKELVRDFLQNLITGLLAFFLRRTYFLDEDILRKLIKAKKLNKFMHLHVVPDVYARYHDQIKNLRTRQLKTEDYDNVAILIRQYLIGGEMAALIVMTVDKPHPRILTSFKPSEKLAKDYKRITFRDPVKERAKTGIAARREPTLAS